MEKKSLYKTDGGFWRGKKSWKIYGKQDSSYCDNFSRERHRKLMLNNIFGKSWNGYKNGNFNCGYMVIWWLSGMQFWILVIELCWKLCDLHYFCLFWVRLSTTLDYLCLESYIQHHYWSLVSKVVLSALLLIICL